MNIRNVALIYNRELKSYFSSLTAYVVIVMFLLVTGYFFYSLLTTFSIVSFQAQTDPMLAKQYQLLNINETVVRPLFGSISIIMLLMTPLLTMRLFSEEKKTGTMELLLTFPVKDGEAILGKFAGCLGILIVMLGMSFPCVVLVDYFGDPEWGVIISGYIGLLMMGAAFISLGIFMSSVTENQIIAAVLSFSALLIFYMVGYSSGLAGESLGRALEYISFDYHFRNFAKGVLDTSDAAYYLLFTIFFLFLSMRSLESKRWRG